jgi:cell division protein FtsW
MARTLKSDKWLLWATMLLLGFSLVMVYSASAVWSMDKFDSPYKIFIKQAIWISVGTVLLFIGMRVDYHFYKKPWVIWSVLGLTLVLLLAVFGFPKINDTRRWITVGGFTLQPSEFAKLAVIFFTGALLDRRMHRINELRYALLPIGIVAGLLTGLIVMEPDFGTSAALGGVVLVMVFAAGLSYRHMGAVVAVLIPVAIVVVRLEPYRVRRLASFLDPGSDPTGDGWQLTQALIAVGSGGPAGRGLMDGVQKLGYIPEPHSDFIYAIIGEELGLIGATAIIICFCIIAMRGVRAAMYAPDRYGALLATGLTAMIAGQAFVNISVVLGLVPTKGIPLPFVSYGGSSMWASLIAMGILLNITQHATSVDPGGRVRREAHTTADPLGVAG